MKKPLFHISDLAHTNTWIKYKSSLCRDCVATCCTMPVEVKLPDLVRMELVDPFDAEAEAPKQIARRLIKAGVVAHFNFRNSLYTLVRRANGECQYLDARSRQCTIYDKRPDTCRNHPDIGPRPGYCAYQVRR